jgi:hypothetical protein
VNLRDNFSGLDFFSHSPWKMKRIFFRGDCRGQARHCKKTLKKKHFFATWEFFFRHCPYLPLWNSLTPGFTKKNRLWKIAFLHAPC